MLESVSNHPQDRRSLWGVGWMSFFWSMATLMAVTLLPSFMTEDLGASFNDLGTIEAVAVALAFLAKTFTGVLSDIYRTRIPLLTVGNILTVAIKPMFALAGNVWWVFAAKSMDRISKGIRSAPADALIADITAEKARATGYGLRQTLYTLGAVVGAACASVLYKTTHNYRLIFWLATIPAALALTVQLFMIRQPASFKIKERKWRLGDVTAMPAGFWAVMLVTFFLMLARFSDAFINIRAKESGWSVADIPLLYVAYEISHALIALPFGRLADRWNRQKLLWLGILVLTLTNLLFITDLSKTTAVFAFACCGLHMGMTQGLLSALVAQHSPAHLRGTAFGLYYLVTMTGVLAGNKAAGLLGQSFGSAKGAFYGGFIWTAAALVILAVIIRRGQRAKS